MFQHFLRYVREENWFLFLKHSRGGANAQEFGPGPDRRRIRFSIELQHMQTVSVIIQDVEFGSVQPSGAGQNATQAVQDGFDRGLLGDCAGHIEQRSVPAIRRRQSSGVFA